MSQKSFSSKIGYVLYKLGGIPLKDIMRDYYSPEELEKEENISSLVLSTMTETPVYREASGVSVEDLEAFVKFQKILRNYINTMEDTDE